MAFEVVDRVNFYGNQRLTIYCESVDDIPSLPVHPDIKIGSEAVIVESGKPLRVFILMHTGWKGPF